jgi:hypothetical protein
MVRQESPPAGVGFCLKIRATRDRLLAAPYIACAVSQTLRPLPLMSLSVFQLDTVKKALTGLFVLGTAGTGVDLFLLGHYEDWTQWIPLTLLICGLGVSVWTLIAQRQRSQLWFRWTGITYAAGGLLGIFLHLKGNREFELEMYPDLGGAKLIAEALTGATPALAPGTMVQLGLLAIIITFIASRREAPASSTDPLSGSEEL